MLHSNFASLDLADLQFYTDQIPSFSAHRHYVLQKRKQSTARPVKQDKKPTKPRTAVAAKGSKPSGSQSLKDSLVKELEQFSDTVSDHKPAERRQYTFRESGDCLSTSHQR